MQRFYQAGDAFANCETGELDGTVIAMKPDGGLMWRFEEVPPGGEVKLPIYICAAHSPLEAEAMLSRVKHRPARGMASPDSNILEALPRWGQTLSGCR